MLLLTANDYIQKLVQAGVLREVTGPIRRMGGFSMARN
jgi:hypothetical protein